MALHALNERKQVRFDEGTHDLRKFEVRTVEDDAKVGVVDDMLIDDRGRGRYLCVSLRGQDRHVLVPAGYARGDRDNRTIWLRGMNADAFRDLPDYRHDPSKIDEAYERTLNAKYDESTSRDFYAGADYRGRGWGRGRQNGGRRLERVDRLDDVRVAKRDPDPRGWDVYGRDGTKLGRIDHLLGDRDTMRVVYLELSVDPKLVDDRRHVLIPVGHVDLELRNERVRVNALDKTRITKLPKHTPGEKLDRSHERKIASIFSEGYGKERRHEHPRYTDQELYGEEEHIERAEEELKVGKRREQAGSVDVKKRVETERVKEPVSVHHEEVEVERRPAHGRASGAKIGEDEIRMPVSKEEVVVEKRPVVQEEIVVRKRDVEDREVVDEKVRRERVDVERHGNV